MPTTSLLVTGASCGIGAAVARGWAAPGRTIHLLARREPLLQEVAGQVRSAGGDAVVHPCDLRDRDAVDSLLAQLADEPPEVLVCNAGLSIARPVLDQTGRFHDVERSMGTNFLGHAQLVLGLLDSMRARGAGQIVGVSTVNARIATPGWSSYVASKGTLDLWLRSIGPELAPHRIAVSIVELGLVRTAMSAPTYGENPRFALSPEQAAAKVLRVIERPRGMQSPWWARAGAVLTAAAPVGGPRLIGRFSRGR